MTFQCGWLLIELLQWAPGSPLVDGLQTVLVVAILRRHSDTVFGIALLLNRFGDGFFASLVGDRADLHLGCCCLGYSLRTGTWI